MNSNFNAFAHCNHIINFYLNISIRLSNIFYYNDLTKKFISKNTQTFKKPKIFQISLFSKLKKTTL